jgi:hypothetical protein
MLSHKLELYRVHKIITIFKAWVRETHRYRKADFFVFHKSS